MDQVENIKSKSRKLWDQRYYQKKKELKMSNLAEIHKSVIKGMKMNGVDKYLGDTDHTEDLVTGILDEEGNREVLGTILDKDLENFVSAVKLDIATDKQGGKNLSTYSNTVKELSVAEEALDKATRVRNQLLKNQKALLAQVSEKAIKAIQVAHADLGVDAHNKKKRKALDGSQPTEDEVPATSAGGWFSFGGSSAGGASKK